VSDSAGWAALAAHVAVAGESVAVIDLPPRGAERGPALLVIHGYPTSSIDFQPVADTLAAHRRVVLLDLPGCGLSDKPDRAYSLFGQADVVEAVAAGRGLDRVDLLTHDMGDSVGGELLARSLDGTLGVDVRRRVVTNGSIYLDLAHLTDGQQALRRMPDAVLPDGLAPDADRLTGLLLDLCAPDLRTDEIRDRLRAGAELVVRGGGNRLLARLVRYIDERARHEPRWTGAIETHPSPLAVVWGRHDPIAVAPMVDRLAQRRPDAAVTWLDAGHWPMVEQPGAFAEAVIAGLDAG
jgi:pimeloyl-ACP methyl ester carboxylesterase